MKTLLAIAIIALAVVGAGLWQLQRQRLAFEEQQYKDQQAAKAEAAQKEAADKEQQAERWRLCRAASEDEYNSDFRTWGDPVPGKPGMRSGPATQIEDMKNRLQRENEECDRNFPKGISY